MNYERKSTPITEFEKKQFEDTLEADHESALRSEKLGVKLADKALKLARSDKSEKKLFSPTLSSRKTDSESITLALNAELRRREDGTEAVFSREWNGSGIDPADFNLLRLTKVEGETVIPPANTLHHATQVERVFDQFKKR